MLLFLKKWLTWYPERCCSLPDPILSCVACVHSHSQNWFPLHLRDKWQLNWECVLRGMLPIAAVVKTTFQLLLFPSITSLNYWIALGIWSLMIYIRRRTIFACLSTSKCKIKHLNNLSLCFWKLLKKKDVWGVPFGMGV